MQNVVGPTLVAMATTFALGAIAYRFVIIIIVIGAFNAK